MSSGVTPGELTQWQGKPVVFNDPMWPSGILFRYTKSCSSFRLITHVSIHRPIRWLLSWNLILTYLLIYLPAYLSSTSRSFPPGFCWALILAIDGTHPLPTLFNIFVCLAGEYFGGGYDQMFRGRRQLRVHRHGSAE